MAKILHQEENEATVKLSGDYQYGIEELIATISCYQVKLVRLSDRNAPQTFRFSKNEIEELVASWNLFQQKQTEKAEAQEKAEEDARIAEEKRLEDIKEEAYSLAYKHEITIDKIDDKSWRLLLSDGKRTIPVKTIDGLLMQVRAVIKHMEEEHETVEETQQVL